MVGPHFAFNKGSNVTDEVTTPAEAETTETVETPATEPVVDDTAAQLSAAMAKIAALSIELEAVKLDLVNTKAANWDLSQMAMPNTEGDAAVSDPQNAVENDDEDEDDEDGTDNPVDDFFGDKED